MKKNILRMFVVFALILSCSLCLVACGNADKKKEEELAGKYELSQVAITWKGAEETEVYTKADYEAMSQSDPMKDFFDELFGEYDVKLEDHKVWKDEDAIATWKVSDGKLVVEPVEDPDDETPSTMTFSAEVVEGNIVITMTDSENQWVSTAVMTLVKK